MNFTSVIIASVCLLVISALLGLLLAVADKYLSVKVDERLVVVTAMLPGYNCGSCGHPGCSGFAAALLAGDAPSVSGCKPSKTEQRVKIAEYLNTTPDANGNTLKVRAE
jgi:electron transport complex protein RnfB